MFSINGNYPPINSSRPRLLYR
eukprot:UN14818